MTQTFIDRKGYRIKTAYEEVDNFKNKINKKGQINFNFGITSFVIFLLIIGTVLFLKNSNAEYKYQFSNGQNLLKNFSLYVLYENPYEGNTTAFLSSTINGTNTSEIISAKIKYYAEKFDYSQTLDIGEDYILSLNNSSTNLVQKSVDTSDLYYELGNNVRVCVTADLRYEELNWIRHFYGEYPSRQLKECKPLSVVFEK